MAPVSSGGGGYFQKELPKLIGPGCFGLACLVVLHAILS